MTALYIGPEIEIPERDLFDSIDLEPVPNDPGEVRLTVPNLKALVGLKVVIGDYLGTVRSADTGELPPVAVEVSDKITDKIYLVHDGKQPEGEPLELGLKTDEAQVVTSALKALVQQPDAKKDNGTGPYEWLYNKDVPNAPVIGANGRSGPKHRKLFADD